MTRQSERELTPLGQYIQEQLRHLRTDEGRPWSIRELARRAHLSHATVLNVMRGSVSPEAASLERIAAALGIPASNLMGIKAGEEQEPDLDRCTRSIAQRLAGLPAPVRGVAVDAVGAVLDAIYDLSEDMKVATPEEEMMFPELGAMTDEELVAHARELIRKRREVRRQHGEADPDGAQGDAPRKITGD